LQHWVLNQWAEATDNLGGRFYHPTQPAISCQEAQLYTNKQGNYILQIRTTTFSKSWKQQQVIN